MDKELITAKIDPDIKKILQKEAEYKGLSLAALIRSILTIHAREEENKS